MRPIPIIALIAALAMTGCGSGSSGTSTSAQGSSTAPTKSSTPATTAKGQGKAKAKGQSGGGGAGQGASNSGGSGATNANGAPLGANTAKPGQGDNSVQTYGSAATGAQRAAVISAMRTFMAAMASYDYPKLCTFLRSQVRAGIAQLAKAGHKPGRSCAALLPKLLPRIGARTKAARAAKTAPITAVRVGGGNAFVIFKPAGAPKSFFVMTRQGGAWKAIGLGTGTPLVPPSG